MDNLQFKELAIDVAERPETLVLRWRGRSTERQPQTILEPFFSTVIAEAQRKTACVEMRFDEVSHFNSSTIGCLIQLINDARRAGVKLRFVYNAKLAWQRLSFDALRVFVVKGDDSLQFELVNDHGEASV